MSKVLRKGFFGFEDSLDVSAATITTAWLPGQFAMWDSSNEGEVILNDGTNNVTGIIIDDDTELATIPSGSKVTVCYGGGKMYIDHADSSTYKAYETDCESGSPGNVLFLSSNGKLTATSGSGSLTAAEYVGWMFQVPTAANNYQLGFVLKI